MMRTPSFPPFSSTPPLEIISEASVAQHPLLSSLPSPKRSMVIGSFFLFLRIGIANEIRFSFLPRHEMLLLLFFFLPPYVNPQETFPPGNFFSPPFPFSPPSTRQLPSSSKGLTLFPPPFLISRPREANPFFLPPLPPPFSFEGAVFIGREFARPFLF